MPFITKNGQKVWITPQRDKAFGKDKYHDTVRHIQIPDYILYGKDENSKYDSKSTPEQIKESRDYQKRKFQSEIMGDEYRTLQQMQMAYTKSINDASDKIYFSKRKSLIERTKKQREEYRRKYDEIEKKLEDYR
jgi:hypothetical protein